MAAQTALKQQTAPAASREELYQQWQQLKEKSPEKRIRDAATELGVSEAELLVTRLGNGVTQLKGPWNEILLDLTKLGELMALTRNESAVHEKHGVYDKISFMGQMGLVVNHDIDLRLFMSGWHLGFAVTEQAKSGTRKSIQFFAKDGSAIHKIYLTEKSDEAAYDALVKKYTSETQSTELGLSPAPARQPDMPDAQLDLAGLRKAWEDMRDTHDFHIILKKFRAGRVQALRLVGKDLSYQVKAEAFREALNKAAAKECGIMVFVGNPGCIQIHSGTVKNLKEVGPWYNVLDPNFNLHLREDHIASAWIVKKPTTDGVVTSLELYDKDGENIALLFGERKPGIPELELWREIVAELPHA